MQVDYVPFVDRLIGHYEGGYGWNKKDPGGPTKYGITCYDLAEHRHQTMTSQSAWAPLVREMPLTEADAIYKAKYADAIRFDELPAGVDCAVMDYAVNSGIARSVRVAAALVGLTRSNVRVDDTLLDALKHADARRLVDSICTERLKFMHAIRGGSAWAEFGRGWQARVDDVRAYGERLAAGSTPAPLPAPDLTKIAQPKAVHVPETAPTKTAGGVVAAGAAAHLSGAPWWGVALACAGVVVAGIGYELWQEHRTTAANHLVHA